MEPSRMTVQAYAIADQALLRRLESEARPLGRTHRSFRLTDGARKPVACVDQASQGQRVAVGWLRDRGFLEVRAGADGAERVVIVRRPPNPLKGRS